MAETQTYGVQKITPDATPNVRSQVESTPEDYGNGPSAQGLQKQAIDLFQEQKKNADQVAVLDADAQFRDKQNDILYNQQTGVLNKQGKDALGITEEASPKLRQAMGNIQDSLSDPAQKAAFQRMAQSRLEESDKIMQVHSRQEFQKYDTNLTDSSVDNEKNTAIQNYTDPDAVKLSISRANAMFEDYGSRHGMPDEWVKDKQASITSNIQSGIITRMLDNGNDVQAQQYYKANKQDISGDQVAAVEKQLEIGSTRGESLRRADSIYNKLPDDATIGDAYDVTANIRDPKIRVATEERLDKLFSIDAQSERQDKENATESATNIVAQSGDIHQVPVETLSKMSPNAILGLSRYAKSVTNGYVQNDPNVYYKYETMATSKDDQTTFMNRNLQELRPALDDQHLNALIKLQQSLREKKGANSPELDDLRTQQSVVNDALGKIGIDPLNADDKANWTQANQFRDDVQRQIDNFKTQNNRSPVPDEIQGMTDNLLVNSITSRGLWNSTSPSFQVPANQPLQYDYDQIPQNDLKQIRQALSSRGIAPTQSKIVDVYTQAQSRRLGRGNNGQ